ncbi:MAG: DUF3179 domain-containing protein [Betaproteobacteria bacterium]
MKIPVIGRGLALCCGIFLAGIACAQTLNGFNLEGALIPPDQIHAGGPPKDGIPAIDAPKFGPANGEKLDAADRVLGLSRNGVVKAYPVRILNWHEIVNDRFGDEPIAITYCPLCGTGIAYIGSAGNRVTTFGVSGLLYNSDMLFHDRATQSLWSQILGLAVAGPLRGQKLAMVALTHTTWADWKARYPRTLVLSTDTGHVRDYSRDPYHGYEASARLMFPVAATSDRLPAKETVLGVELNGAHKAYAFSEMAKALGDRQRGTIEDRLGGVSIAIRFDREHRTAQVLAGAGQELPGIVGYWFAWSAFFPKTDIFVAR